VFNINALLVVVATIGLGAAKGKIGSLAIAVVTPF